MKKDCRDRFSEKAWKYLFFFCLMVCIFMGAFVNCHGQSKQEVYVEILNQGIEHPEIVLRQAIKETGWMECTECSLDHNNLFGFRWKKKYLEFDTWQESVAYYKKWQTKWFDGQRSYYNFLGCMWKHRNGDCVPYATSETYIEELKLINI